MFKLDFSAFSDPVHEQLDAQGLRCPSKMAPLWERQRKAINFLYLHGILTAAENQKAEFRLVKRIAKHIRLES